MPGNYLAYAATQGATQGIKTERQKEEKGKIVEDYSRDSAPSAIIKSIGPALETG